MSEKEIEEQLKIKVRRAGGTALKFVSPGNSGVPDRVVILPGGKIGFVELKASGKKLRPDQRRQQERLKELGCCVAVVDNAETIDAIIRKIKEFDGDIIPLF